MRIPLVEVGEKESVGEMLEARSVVGHDIGLAWEVEGGVVVAMIALVAAGPVAEVGGRAVGGDGAFADAGDGGRVVGAVDHRGVANVMGVSHEIHLAQETSVLEVAVGDGAGWVVGVHEAALDLGRKGVSP